MRIQIHDSLNTSIKINVHELKDDDEEEEEEEELLFYDSNFLFALEIFSIIQLGNLFDNDEDNLYYNNDEDETDYYVKNNNINIKENFFLCDNDNMESCSICFSNIKRKEEVCKLSLCGHTYHSKCIENWAKRKQNCPLCREEINFELINET